MEEWIWKRLWKKLKNNILNVNLMQFLMQRQDKVIKNEVEIDKIAEYDIG